MKELSEFNSSIEFLFTDIDDTLTFEGQLGPEAYEALWQLHDTGVKVIPVTGRPAGWCEMIARMWPVHGIIGENGGFYFRYHDKKMHRHFFNDADERANNQKKLELIKQDVLTKVPKAGIASDQFCRLMDLAIDFCEDVDPLSKAEVTTIKNIFENHGAIAKVSSIHVNGWFGDYDKLSMSLEFLKNEFSISPERAKEICAFSGDSPNDEPMFAYFPHSFAVANIRDFLKDIKCPPTYVANLRGGLGFQEIAEVILKNH